MKKKKLKSKKKPKVTLASTPKELNIVFNEAKGWQIDKEAIWGNGEIKL